MADLPMVATFSNFDTLIQALALGFGLVYAAAAIRLVADHV